MYVIYFKSNPLLFERQIRKLVFKNVYWSRLISLQLKMDIQETETIKVQNLGPY